jgi:L-lactate dehydrogenase complex protein LldE
MALWWPSHEASLYAPGRQNEALQDEALQNEALQNEALMRVALFVPCYVDQLCPDVALSALELLEALGLEVVVPDGQTCCGQVLINGGSAAAARPLAANFQALFAEHEHVVCPSGSCVATLRQHAHWFGAPAGHPGTRVQELCEFLVDVVGVRELDVAFPFRVALHQSCHALRELGLAPSSELCTLPPAARATDRVRMLLSAVRGASVVELERRDECCGFGGSFCVGEAEVSARMGEDRIADFERAGAEVVTSGDASCLLHLSGLLRRQNKPLAVMHIAQILAGRPPPRAAHIG